MCGIVGELFFKPLSQEPNLNRDLALLKHRGPDDLGQWFEAPCLLGHRRLSIIDLSEDGHQPFHSRCGRWHLTYNGEIYNYLELRKSLEDKGIHFHTQTDTEVLLEILIHEGIEGLNKCNGMWAFALWDSQEKKLTLARDHFGIKPLFYRTDNASLKFASEIKALFKTNEIPEVNRPYLYHFIDRNEGHRNDSTIYKNIKKLLPGYFLTVQNQQIKTQAWYKLKASKEPTGLNQQERVKAFRDLFVDAIKVHYRSDRPVGVCLSGGVDSSIVSGILSRELNIPIKTFSSVHKHPGYNEEKFINDVNDFCQAESHKLMPNANDFDEVLTALICAHDVPVRMPGTYSHWHVMKCAADHVTVLLDGQGADELFGGYRYYYPAAQEGWIYRALKGDVEAAKLWWQCSKGVRQHIGPGYTQAFLSRIFRKFFPRQENSQRWQDAVCHHNFINEGKMLSPEPIENVFKEPLDQELYKSFVANNLPMLLDFEDRISMAFSLEARVPFLDHRVVEFCFGLPVDDKIRGYTNKALLRDAFADLIPESVKNRKDKLGFPTPTEIWFRNELKEMIHERLSDPSIARQGFFDQQKVLSLWEEHLKGQKNHERLLWRVLSIQKWSQLYLESSPT